MQLDFPVEGLRELAARIPDEAKRRRVVYRVLERLALLGEAEAKKRAPHRTGHLQRTIRHRGSVAEGVMLLQAEAGYAPFVEGGTGLYGPRHERIFPKTARALRWPAGTTGPQGNLRQTGRTRAGQAAQFVFARSIAGMRPHPFMAPARAVIEASRSQVLEAAAAQLFGSLESTA